MCMSGGSAPAAPALPPALPPPPTIQDPAVAQAGAANINAAQNSFGMASTILTGGEGIANATDPVNTTKKTVLGS